MLIVSFVIITKNVICILMIRIAAKSILEVAERVEKALDEAQVIQKDVGDDILTTNQFIVDATNSLTKVSVKSK